VIARKRLVQYGIAAVVVVAVACLAYVQWGGGSKPETAAKPTASRQSSTPSDPDEPKVLSPVQTDRIRELVGQARQLAGDGKFAEADASLDQADKIAKGLPEVAQARREIAQIKTPEGQLSSQLTKARLAVEHGDAVAAEKALAEVEKLKPDAPEIAELRTRLQADQARAIRRDSRIVQHLTAMREAIGRKDLAVADSELNAAERIDPADPTVRQARIELNRARNAALKKD
jgi:predicted Zn-dependent protease